MTDNLKEFNKENNLFKTVYCLSCKQRKVCGKLNSEYCCPCAYQMEQERTQELSSYWQFYRQKVKQRKELFQQLQLLKNYQGCKNCGNLAVDACSLYQESQLICQPCLTKEKGNSTSPISFWNQQKWYKKHWGINLIYWLETYKNLPVNSDCAIKWKENQYHLNNCQCLRQEVKEIYRLFTSSLKRYQEQLKECQCETSKKVRIGSDNFAWCEKCEETIAAASKKRVIKNRNDPKFWELEVKERVLCLRCIGKYKKKMPVNKRYVFNKYVKRGYV